MKKWLVASYKSKELTSLKNNLENQNFSFFLPTIRTRKKNFDEFEEILFPGYIFVNIDPMKFSTLSFTKGIKEVIKFGNTIPYIEDEEIDNIKLFEHESKKLPIRFNIKIGQSVEIKYGTLKGNLAKICSLPEKNRIDVLIHLLGAVRKVNINLKDIMM